MDRKGRAMDEKVRRKKILLLIILLALEMAQVPAF